MEVDNCHAQEGNECWIVDSGAPTHLVRDEKLLQNAVSCLHENIKVQGFSGKISVISCTGDAYLPISSSEHIKLRDVICIPNSDCNLLSVSRLTTDYPFSIIFNPSGFVVKNLKTKKLIAKGYVSNGDYVLANIINSSISRMDEKPVTMKINALYGSVIAYVRKLAARLLQDLCYNSFTHDIIFGDAWVVDSGATAHSTNNKNLLQNLRPLVQKIIQTDLFGRTSQATHIGDAYLPGRWQGIMLRDILVIPEAKLSIVSVSKLISDYPSCLEFRSDGFVLKSLDENTVMAEGPKQVDWYLWVNKKNQSPKKNSDKVCETEGNKL